MIKTKITEIKETYTVKSRIRGDGVAADGSKFEYKTLTRYKEVVTVDGWARFGHFMLDRVFFYILDAIVEIAIGIIVVFIGFEHSFGSQWLQPLLSLFTYFVIYPGYYLFFEYFMQGTPGKLILGRVVINEYGEKPTFGQILGRSYARIVPFEAFSCFSGLGWHDSWTETMVIRKKDLKELNLALKVQQFDADGTQ